jgi:DNA-binding MarR family transcriptional regulator
MKEMERTLRLLPRQQLFLDLAYQVPEADIAAVETYLYFARVASDIFANQQAFFGRYELSEGKLVVLQLLRQAPHYRLTPSALAEAAGVTRGTMTGLLAGLERSGLVKRDEHPEDGRMFSIELTEAALDLFERILPERITRIMEFMSSLTQEEQHQLRAFLEKMERGLPALSAS